MGDWRTNTTLRDLGRWLCEGERVCVLTHSRPDGDAIGSTLGVVRLLRPLLERRGGDAQQVRAFYASTLPHWLADVAHGDEWEEANVERLIAWDPDRIVICDTGSWMQLREVAGLLEGRADRTCIIDHHLNGDAEIAGRIYLETDSAAACQAVLHLGEALLGGDEISREVGEALYVGIATDTGWFRHSNVDARVLQDAARLLGLGVSHSHLYEVIEQQDPAGRIILMGRVLSRLELACDERLAILRVLLSDIRDVGLSPGQTSGLGDPAMHIRTVRVAATLTQTEEQPPVTKVSLRSKEGDGAVDVAQVARALGGGGHARAAGARVAGEIEEVAARIVELVGEALG